jgi:hypothetical protein
MTAKLMEESLGGGAEVGVPLLLKDGAAGEVGQEGEPRLQHSTAQQ